jgi:hypothetical protein
MAVEGFVANRLGPGAEDQVGVGPDPPPPPVSLPSSDSVRGAT